MEGVASKKEERILSLAEALKGHDAKCSGWKKTNKQTTLQFPLTSLGHSTRDKGKHIVSSSPLSLNTYANSLKFGNWESPPILEDSRSQGDFLDSLSGLKDSFPSLISHIPGELGQNTREASSSINTVNLSSNKEDSMDLSEGEKVEGKKYNLQPRKKGKNIFLVELTGYWVNMIKRELEVLLGVGNHLFPCLKNKKAMRSLLVDKCHWKGFLEA
jgi:hypothetical protein